MIFFGHLGIGDAMAEPVRGKLPRSWLLLGTVLPDLIDKPLYYGLAAAVGRQRLQAGFLRGTRSFGHTGLLAGLVWAVGRARRDPRGPALALGMATHIILDVVADLALWGPASAARGCAAFWPLTGWQFPIQSAGTLTAHFRAVANPFLLGCEALGLLLLLRHRALARPA